MVNYLTKEQKCLIPLYRKELKQRLVSTVRINPEISSKAIEDIYSLLGREKPQIVFCKSPFDALSKIILSLLDGEFKEVAIRYIKQRKSIEYNLTPKELYELDFTRTVQKQVSRKNVRKTLGSKLWLEIETKIRKKLETQIQVSNYNLQSHKSLSVELRKGLLSLLFTNSLYFNECPHKSLLSGNAIEYFGVIFGHNCRMYHIFNNVFEARLYDYKYPAIRYLIECVKCQHDKQLWQAYNNLIDSNFSIYPFSKVCYVSDRPINILYKDRNKQIDYIIEFSDNYQVFICSNYHKLIYSRNGTTILVNKKTHEISYVCNLY